MLGSPRTIRLAGSTREVDLYVTADLIALTKVHLGRLRIEEAMERGLVEVGGPHPLVHAFPSWVGVSAFARYGRPREALPA